MAGSGNSCFLLTLISTFLQFEENGKRMLLLNLTDGLGDIQAMEYQFISHINTSTPPGTKVTFHTSLSFFPHSPAIFP